MGSWARRTGFRGSSGSDIELGFAEDGKHVSNKPSVSKAPAPAARAAGDVEAPAGSESGSRNNSGQLRIEPLRLFKDPDEAGAMSPDDHMVLSDHSHMKYELRESPGLGTTSFPSHRHLCQCIVSVGATAFVHRL